MRRGGPKGGVQLSGGQPGERHRRPTLATPSVRNRRESVGRGCTFEGLLVGQELDVRRPPVGSERRIDAIDLERCPVEVGGGRRAGNGKRQPLHIRRVGHKAFLLAVEALAPDASSWRLCYIETVGDFEKTAAFQIPFSPVSVDEFIACPGDGVGGRYQLVDGQIVAQAPASANHGTIQSNCARHLGNHLDTLGSRCRVVTEPAVRPRLNADTNLRVPDIGVTCALPTAGEIELPNPVVLVEVLSPGNSKQMWDNVRAYATIPSVQEVVVLQSSRIEADLLMRQGDGHWPPSPVRLGPDGLLALPSLGFEFAVKALYAKTYLDR